LSNSNKLKFQIKEKALIAVEYTPDHNDKKQWNFLFMKQEEDKDFRISYTGMFVSTSNYGKVTIIQSETDKAILRYQYNNKQGYDTVLTLTDSNDLLRLRKNKRLLFSLQFEDNSMKTVIA